MSVHSGDPNNCTLFGDMREAYGDEYTNAWPTQVKKNQGGFQGRMMDI